MDLLHWRQKAKDQAEPWESGFALEAQKAKELQEGIERPGQTELSVPKG